MKIGRIMAELRGWGNWEMAASERRASVSNGSTRYESFEPGPIFPGRLQFESVLQQARMVCDCSRGSHELLQRARLTNVTKKRKRQKKNG